VLDEASTRMRDGMARKKNNYDREGAGGKRKGFCPQTTGGVVWFGLFCG